MLNFFLTSTCLLSSTRLPFCPSIFSALTPFYSFCHSTFYNLQRAYPFLPFYRIPSALDLIPFTLTSLPPSTDFQLTCIFIYMLTPLHIHLRSDMSLHLHYNHNFSLHRYLLFHLHVYLHRHINIHLSLHILLHVNLD